MVAGIVSVGDAGALGIVANGGEWGGKEQGEDSPGSGFNLGIRAAKADSIYDAIKKRPGGEVRAQRTYS